MFDNFTPLSVNKFLDKLAPNVLNNRLINPLCCSFDSFLIYFLGTAFIVKPSFSKYLTIFIKSLIFSFVVILDPKIFLSIGASTTQTVAINPAGIKTL